MRIGFASEELQKVFNRRDKLVAAYGPKLARSIGVRMAVLKEANHLGLVPRSSPIGLTVTDVRSRSFSVALVGRRLLLFRSAAHYGGELDFSSIREILVLAVK